ncbi:MAG: hypothetical protein Q9228_004563 [Teloschistes exilis]
MSPSMMFAASPNVESHRSRPSTAEKGDDPPRNATGQITCVHPNCENVEPVFSRRCEWTGFTYSGGLSRHQREVHRQHGGPKACYMCPHQDCKRSTGSGFSRKENLQEHLRRVHRQVTEGEADLQAINSANIQATTGPKRRMGRLDDEDDQLAEPVSHEPRKRKRQDEDEEDDDADDEYRKEDLSAQVKRLRKELREKDERLRKLEQTVELLTRRNV